MGDLAPKLCNISPTYFRDFLSPEEEDTLFLNDLEEEFVFFFWLFKFFYRRKLAKIADSSNSQFLVIVAMASGGISG